MHELHSQIEIDATPEEVWRVLVDVDRYHEWNPSSSTCTVSSSMAPACEW